MFKEYSLNRLLALFTTAGFLFLLTDSIIEHWSAFSQEIMCFIPVVFSAFGLIIGILAVRQWNGQWIRRFHVLLLATFVISAAGLYFHIEEEEETSIGTTVVCRSCCIRLARHIKEMAGRGCLKRKRTGRMIDFCFLLAYIAFQQFLQIEALGQPRASVVLMCF
jgi:hypothetical protein